MRYMHRGLTSGAPQTLTVCRTLEHTGLLAGYPDLLTVEHICELTGLSPQTVRKVINEGRLPGCRIGRRLYVPKPSFLSYVKEGGGVHAPNVATR